ncbi:cytochrome P450 [Streptomyces sp. SBT349]|uniref:cytochrome P450 n=1 Tax=Streptomyces sp. SBT349 TaxID=1580539 RepID=UPI00066CD0BC|nr:cytochrome P450 [Streptomyces sp. SBT349]
MPPAASSTIDLFSDPVLTDPYPIYEELREKGAAVYLKRHNVWALPRYQDVRATLRDPVTFSSVDGIALTDDTNRLILGGTVLASDGQDHLRLRRILGKQLGRPAIRRLTDQIRLRADRLVAELVEHGTFDAATDLAERFVADNVMHLMGLPEDTREQVLAGAAPTFDMFGPSNQRYLDAAPAAAAMIEFLTQQVTRDTVRPGSWMHDVFDAVDAGEIGENEAVPLMSAYTAASMDTTQLAITSAIYLLATHPDQFTMLRAYRRERRVTPENVFHETLRLDAPIQGFGRRVTRNTVIGGTTIEAGQQVWLLYGSTGRDTRRWKDPDAFTIRRPDAHQHLALGEGAHTCAGNHLAELQAAAVIDALAARCTRLEPQGQPQRALNNILRGWSHLPITVRPDGRRAR